MPCFLLAALSQPAQAIAPGDVVLDQTNIIDSSSAPFLSAHGAGSPAVMWDEVRSRWVMVFEYQSATTDPDCPHGIWGLALTTTTDLDGLTGWSTPISVYEPTVDGSYKSCVVAHPATYWRTANRRNLGVIFKGETDLSNCAVGDDPNTCVYAGIGHMNISFDNTGAYSSYGITASARVDMATLFPGTQYGFQSPVFSATSNLYTVLIQIGSDIYTSQTSNPQSANWSNVTLVQTAGATSWDADELFGQELVCGDNTGEVIAFQGGRTFSPGGAHIAEAGMGLMTSVDGGVSWSLDPNPLVTWNNDTDWRHWAAKKVGTDAYFFWVVNKVGGMLQIDRYSANVVTTPVPKNSACP
ncbi:MAG: hypothetical protein H6735_25360 [Alphaproteobacteria bacterium]|nr:hypothetical protein [Alphaproteobacteria bacterium]